VDGDARGAGNGSSWANAFNSLQDALAAARQGSEVWVAQGVYTPDNGAGISRGDRSASFGLKSGVAIKGGYAGVGEPNSNARDVKVYATILSGDLGRNDLPGVDPCDLSKQTSRADNSRHVLTAINVDGTAILDGVQVVGGYAEPADTGGPAPASQSQGAGLYISSSELHLRACIFSGNWASVGGGAIYVTDGHAELTGCTLRANAAGDQGGAIDNEGGETWLTGCVICQNAAGISGGGAIWNSNGTLRLVNCTLNGNSSDYGGGAIANAGGGLYATNCCFHANYAKALAGAIYNFLSAKATLWDCTIAGNRQDGYAGTVVCGPLLGQAPNELSITNCILWDGGDEIGNLAKSSIVVTRSDVRGGWFGVGNIDADPLFVAPAGLDSIAGTEDDDLRLGPLSPCIDMGDTTLLPADTADLDVDGDVEEPLPLDLDGRRRVAGNAVDMGAYEYQVSISSCMSDISPLYDGARAGGM
jgi:predicted outer membrane repeat protein